MIILEEHLIKIAGKKTKVISDIIKYINDILSNYEINTLNRCSHFIAQACHETDRFKTLSEYASGKNYENRKDLGNINKGDGEKFKGRGIFQTTGRDNYLKLGILKGNKNLFIENPELLENPEYAIWSACEYWKSKKLNEIADNNDEIKLKKKFKGNVIEVSPIEYISLVINGGYSGMDERKHFYLLAKKSLS